MCFRQNPSEGMLQPTTAREFWNLSFALVLSQLKTGELGFLMPTYSQVVEGRWYIQNLEKVLEGCR